MANTVRFCGSRDRPGGDDGIPTSATGYHRRFGVTAGDEDLAFPFVVMEVGDGTIDFEKTTVCSVGAHSLDAPARVASSDPKIQGVWYRGEREIYGDRGNGPGLQCQG